MTSGRVNSGRVHSGRVHVRPHGLLDVLRRGNLGALILPLFLLAAGWGARTRLARKTVAYHWRGVQLSHPAGWTLAETVADPNGGDSVVLMDLLGPGRIKPRVTLRTAPLPGLPSPTNADANAAAPDPASADAADATAPGPVATAISEALSNRLPLYYAIAEQAVQIGDFPATRVDSAFAFTPHGVPGRKRDIPVVMRAIDLVLLRGADALSVQVAAPIEDFEAQRPILEAMIASLRIDPAAARASDGQTPDRSATEPSATTGGENSTEPQPGVTVAGQIVDAESGLPVPGAIVLFLAPGTNVADVTDDNLTAIAYTTGLADSTGHFTGNRPLGRAAHYGVMFVADGYRWIASDDGISVGGDTPVHMDVGAVKLRRR